MQDARLSPSWDASLAALALRVTSLASRVRLARAVTPSNWDAEIERLVAARRAGGRAEPSFAHRPQDDGALLAEELEQIAAALAGHGPLPTAIAERAREAALEARMAHVSGTPALLALARTRYRSSAAEDARALRWAKTHAGEREEEDEATSVSDDDRDPESLLSSMRRAVGERRLPYRVTVNPGMAALAATGDEVIVIAAGRRLRARDVARTVTHEIEGHAMPAIARRARSGPLAFRLAGDTDAEEGRALACEKRARLFDRTRRKELALRHVAACRVHDGVAFEDVAAELESLGAGSLGAVRIAARAARGGGLGRERVYLPSFWRIHDETPGEPSPRPER